MAKKLDNNNDESSRIPESTTRAIMHDVPGWMKNWKRNAPEEEKKAIGPDDMKKIREQNGPQRINNH